MRLDISTFRFLTWLVAQLSETTSSPKPASRRAAADGLLTTGDMARLTGSTLRTVRFYEEAALLVPDERREGGHRMFRPAAVERLQLILDLREAGLSLGEIRELFDLREKQANDTVAAQSLADALAEQAEQMERKIELLRRLKEELSETSSQIAELKNDGSLTEDAPRAAKLLWG